MKKYSLILIMTLFWGCSTKKQSRIQEKEKRRIEYRQRDSIGMQHIYQRLQDRVIRVERIEWSLPDSVGRQYRMAETAVVVEEKEKEEMVTEQVFRSGLQIEEEVESVVEEGSVAEVQVGKGIWFGWMGLGVVLLGGFLLFLFRRFRGK